jgi:hypothetical protein
MPYPDPEKEPDVFIDCLKAAGITGNLGLTALQHFQNRPHKSFNGRLDVPTATKWYQDMDLLLVCSFYYSLPHASN